MKPCAGKHSKNRQHRDYRAAKWAGPTRQFRAGGRFVQDHDHFGGPRHLAAGIGALGRVLRESYLFEMNTCNAVFRRMPIVKVRVWGVS